MTIGDFKKELPIKLSKELMNVFNGERKRKNKRITSIWTSINGTTTNLEINNAMYNNYRIRFNATLKYVEYQIKPFGQSWYSYKKIEGTEFSKDDEFSKELIDEIVKKSINEFKDFLNSF